MKASTFNDPFEVKGGIITTSSNRAGGVLGGITYGTPVIFRFAVKPTPSVLLPQKSVDLRTMKSTMMSTEGRFDANFTPRVQVVAEAVSAVITTDHLMLSGYISQESVIPRNERLRYDVLHEQS